MAALLTSVGDDKDKLALYLNECRRMGITVLPPDVNESVVNFTPVGEDIRFGMAAVRNVGANVVEAIVRARTSEGAFTSFNDFLSKVELVVCNKRTIESLVKSGAFDQLGHTRRALVDVHEQAIDDVVSQKKNEAKGEFTFDIFAMGGDTAESEGEGLQVEVPDLPEWERKDMLSFEREMLGLYVSDHPLRGLDQALAEHSDTSVQQVLSEDGGKPDGAIVTVAGMITSVQRRIAKSSGNAYARIELEDRSGSVEIMFFGKVYAPIAGVLAEDLICSIKGRVQKRDDGSVSMSAMELTLPEIHPEGHAGPVTITVPERRLNEQTVGELASVLRSHRGDSEVRLRVGTQRATQVWQLPPQYRVEAGPAFFGDLKVLLGPACLEG